MDLFPINLQNRSLSNWCRWFKLGPLLSLNKMSFDSVSPYDNRKQIVSASAFTLKYVNLYVGDVMCHFVVPRSEAIVRHNLYVALLLSTQCIRTRDLPASSAVPQPSAPQKDRPQMTIWHMYISCWIHKSTNLYLKWAILNAFALLQWLFE